MYVCTCVYIYIYIYLIVSVLCTYVVLLTLCSCISAHEIAPEGKYPPIYENSDPVILGKIKRIKSMQPKSLDEEGITKSGMYMHYDYNNSNIEGECLASLYLVNIHIIKSQ